MNNNEHNDIDSDDKIVISVIGTHSSDSIYSIIDRKQRDISKVGNTYWIANIRNSDRQVIKENKPTHVLFIEGADKNSAKNTKCYDKANVVSIDGEHWEKLPDKMGDITGHVKSRKQVALNLKNLELKNDAIDLSNYKFEKFTQNSSTCFAEKGKNPNPLKSNIRRVIAVGTLSDEGIVFVKGIENLKD